jgi:hypothetical protein
MKTTSLLALSTALLLCTANVSIAQDVSAGAGAGASGSVSGSMDGVSTDVNAGAEVDASVDTDGDGTADDDETAGDDDADAGGNGTTGGSTSGDTDLDTDGDGVISDEEQAAAESDDDDDQDSPSGTEDCAAVDLSGTGMMGTDDVAAIASATSVTVVRLTDCEDDSSADLNSEVESALFGNSAISAQLAQQGIGGGEILGLSGSDGAITVYVAQDDSESGEGEAATSSEGGSTSGTSQ